jgi:DNA-binding NtrC family response regulator
MLAVDGVLLNTRSQVSPHAWLRPEHDRTSPMQSTVTIMVVDDDERGRRITSRMLRDEGYEVIEAQSAEHALQQLAEAGEVQVVLADIAMPGGMNGVELGEKVQEAEPWRRVVLMSGYDRLFPKWGETGARFPLLMKPFTAEQLLRQMHDVLKGGMH